MMTSAEAECRGLSMADAADSRSEDISRSWRWGSRSMCSVVKLEREKPRFRDSSRLMRRPRLTEERDRECMRDRISG